MRRYYNGRWAPNYYHRGVDYGADEGDAVTAPADGIVSFVGYEDKGFAIHVRAACKPRSCMYSDFVFLDFRQGRLD